MYDKIIMTTFVTGPLLYHFENTAKEPSIEIAYDVLRQVILDFSFVLLVSHLYTVFHKQIIDNNNYYIVHFTITASMGSYSALVIGQITFM